MAITGYGGAFILDGNSDIIHFLNQVPDAFDLSADSSAYLRFFCQFVRADEGPFEITESPDQVPWLEDASAEERQRMSDMISPPQRLGDDAEGRIQFKATLLYADALFRVRFAVAPSSGVEMIDDEPLASDLPILRRKYDGPLVGELGSWEPEDKKD